MRGRKSGNRKDPPAPAPAAADIPSRADVLKFLADNPDLSAKRELIRAFGIHGAARRPFNALLREMRDEGLIAGDRRRVRPTAGLPSVAVLEIPPDADPEAMLAYPLKWDEDAGPRPPVEIVTPHRARVVPGPGDRVLARIERRDGETPAYAARAMKILERPRRAMIGIVRKTKGAARLEPVERKGRELTIRPGDLGEARDGDLVEVEPVGQGRATAARVTAVVGNPLSEKAISLIALTNLDIPHTFSGAALAEAEAARPAGPEGREDWRDLPLVTIDPEDARDHDDAVHAAPDPDPANTGGFVITVAIADVAFYVRPGTALDREAYERGNSVYFPDRVVPMLPERLSTDLCSLRPGEDRPAMAVRMVVGPDGERRGHSFHRVLMRSAARLTYTQAQAAIDGTPDETTGPLLDDVLRPLWAAYGALRTAREKRQPLDLDLPERRIKLDRYGLVEDVVVPERLAAHRLIEEMMIAANVSAAETLEAYDTPLLYRVHDAPSMQKLEDLRAALRTMQLSLVKDRALRPLHFNRILARAGDHPSPELIHELILRAQAQAEYADDNYGHFGLNLRRYAHFTSPIRRYADLVVHRALIRALELGPGGLTEATEQKLAGIGQHLSMAERRAMAAERETEDRLLALYLADKVGERFSARISGVTRAGLFVSLDTTGADGFVPAASLGRDWYRLVEAELALVGDRTGERFRVGDKVEVRLVEAAPMAGALRFELLSEGEFVRPTGRRKGPARRGHKRPAPRRKRTA
jgi:ribonuclease R